MTTRCRSHSSSTRGRSSISTPTIRRRLGRDYLGFVPSGGPAVPISDIDVDIDDFDDFDLLAAEITISGADSGDLLAINGSLPFGIVATAIQSDDRRPQTGRSGLP